MSDHCYPESGGLITVNELLAVLRGAVQNRLATETIKIDLALRRVIASEIISTLDLPPFDNAAVDGFAMDFGDLQPASWSLPVGPTIRAGETPSILDKGFAARIMTGAPLPKGANTVVMQEDVVVADGIATFPNDIKEGLNWRPAGEDVALGQRVFAAGSRLDFSAIGMLAALGFDSVEVYRPLKVALFSSGDEIAEVGQSVAAGQRFDANRPMLKGLLGGLGYEIIDCGVLPDNSAATEAALLDVAACHDIIVTSGGASTGEADFIISSVKKLGKIHAWRLALKPGRPFAFGHLNTKPVLCLPGNPVAVGVCALIFLVPFLAAMSGRRWPEPIMYPIQSAFSMKKKAGRTEYVRAILEQTEKGPQVARYAKQGSGILMSLVEGDGLVCLPSNCEAVAVGDMVSFIPFEQFY